MHTQMQITLTSLAFDHCLSVIGTLTLTKIIYGGKLTVRDISDDIFSYCTPFLFQIPGAPDDEAVRIFLEFERVESAIKAIVDLNGRYFGGRVVKACFYSLDKFRVLDLAEQV